MKQAATNMPKKKGRPLSFDRAQVLHRAMLQFWRSGYETTSVADLTQAMGITAPSLYSTFGDKESLFLECLNLYTNSGDKTSPQLIGEAPSGRQAAEDLLNVAANWFTQRYAPPGCLVASAASTGSAGADRVRQALKGVREANQKALQKRIERDRREGQMPAETDARSLAAMTMAVVQGMSTLARDGADRKVLLGIVRTALAAWPATDPGGHGPESLTGELERKAR